MTELQHRSSWTRTRAKLLSATVAVSLVAGGLASAPGVAQAAPGDPIIFGINGFGSAAVTEIDIEVQTTTQVGNVARESSAIDLDPANGRLYFYEWQDTGNEFGYFDPISGATTIVRTYSPGPGHSMMRMAFAPGGTLYAMDVDDSLFTIDPATGDLSELGTVDGLDGQLTTGTGDMSFADDGTLYVAVDRNLYTVDLGSLDSTLLYSGMIPVSGVGFTVWTGLAHCDGVMYASNVEQRNNRAGIFTIDPATGDQELLFYSPSRLNDLASCSQVEPPANSAPVGVDGTVSTPAEQPVAITLVASDVDGDALTYEVTTGPTGGALTGTAPNLTYTPDVGFSGTDAVTFVANDGELDSAPATITITVDEAGANNAPIAIDDELVTLQDEAISMTLSASDADGDALTYEVTVGPSAGVLSGAAPGLTYTPNTGFSGIDTVTFVANDGLIDSNPATVTITVEPAPSGPGAPTSVTATPSDGTVALSWQAPIDDGGSPITDYVIESARRGESWAVVADGVSASTTATISGLANYDEYRFRVATVNQSETGEPSAAIWSTPSDGNDPEDTFNYPDGGLSDQPNWTEIDPIVLTDLVVNDGYVIGTGDPDGTGTALTIPVGPDVEVTMDALLGDSYNEASIVLRLPSTTHSDEAYLLQWVTDGDYVRAGTVTGPAIQIWRLDPNVRPTLLADAVLPDNGERTLTFGAQGDTLYIAENGTVLMSVTDDTYPGGDYLAVGQADFSDGGTPTRLDNLRYEILDTPNTAPVADDSAIATATDQAVAVTLSASDADGDPLTYAVTGGPASGVLSGTAPDLTYTPNSGFSGTDTVVFVANDGQVDSDPATVTITVEAAANNAPVADDAAVITLEDESVAVTLTASDIDGDALSYAVTGGPASGVLSGTAPDLTYTPNSGFSGTDTVVFVANDGQVDSDPATVTITVDAAPAGPGAPTALAATPSDGTVALSWQAPIDDGGSPITDYVVEFARRGESWEVFADGVSTSTTATVTGLTNYDEYRFRIATSNTTETGVPADAIWSTPSDGDDPDETFNHPDGSLGDRPGWSVVDPDVFGDLQLVDGYAVGTGDPDGTGTAFSTPVGPDVEITIDALLGDSYNEASVVLRMAAIDDFSSAYLLQWVTDGDHGVSGTVTGPAIQILRLDPGSQPALLAEAALAADGERTLTFGAQGTTLYIEEAGTVLLSATDDTHTGGDFFTLGQANLSDGGTPSRIDNLRYEIVDAAPNTPPVANDDTIATTVDEPVATLLTASDVDGDDLTYQVTAGPANGTLTGTAPNLTYTPDAGFSGTDTIGFVANDGQVDSEPATVTVTVTESANNAPTADDASVTTNEDEAVAIVLSASDVDGDALSFEVTAGPSNGTLSGAAPTLTYTPNAGFVGTDTVTFVASDGQTDSDPATVTITVDESDTVLTIWGADRARRTRAIDLTNGTSTSEPRMSFGTQAMDRDPVTGDIFYYEWSSSGNEFASWDPDTGSNTQIRTYSPGPGLFVVQMGFAPDGTLYVIDDASVLHTIDPANGDITTLGAISGMTSGPYGQWGDLTFTPDGTAYIATYGEMYTLDVATRTATLLHADMFDGAGFLWMGLSHCDGRFFGSHIDFVNRSAIFEIDIATGAITELQYLPGYVGDLTGCASS